MEQGERLGRQEGERGLVERLIVRASGASMMSHWRVRAASSERLTAIALRVGQAASLDEVFQDE